MEFPVKKVDLRSIYEVAVGVTANGHANGNVRYLRLHHAISYGVGEDVLWTTRAKEEYRQMVEEMGVPIPHPTNRNDPVWRRYKAQQLESRQREEARRIEAARELEEIRQQEETRRSEANHLATEGRIRAETCRVMESQARDIQTRREDAEVCECDDD